MEAKTQPEIPIIDGPSREEQYDGARLSFEKRYVEFTFFLNKSEIKIKALILGISPEDNIGESWKLSLGIKTSKLRKLKSGENDSVVIYEAFYSTRTRKGKLLLEPRCHYIIELVLIRGPLFKVCESLPQFYLGTFDNILNKWKATSAHFGTTLFSDPDITGYGVHVYVLQLTGEGEELNPEKENYQLIKNELEKIWQGRVLR